MSDMCYKAAYERQKQARELAENALEEKSRALYESHTELQTAYTKLKEQKSQILHQEKLATIGQLSAGVAHEINNPTGFVKSNLDTLGQYVSTLVTLVHSLETHAIENTKNRDETSAFLEKTKADADLEFLIEDVEELLEDSIDGTKRIQTIVSSLKNFARPDSKINEKFCLGECIENTLKLVRSQIKDKANLVVNTDADTYALGRQGEISQVILNLVTNALDAIEIEGEITITTQKKDDLLQISVSDNGSGIDEKDISHIFDPFYSTKDVGKGTGLGLSISYGIIKSHNGSIYASSEPGKGTTFAIHLPAA